MIQKLQLRFWFRIYILYGRINLVLITDFREPAVVDTKSHFNLLLSTFKYAIFCPHILCLNCNLHDLYICYFCNKFMPPGGDFSGKLSQDIRQKQMI